jgi:cytochrome P450
MIEVGDPVADRALSMLPEGDHGAAGGHLEQIRSLADQGVAEAEAFVEASNRRPSWYDADLIERGQRLAAGAMPLYGLSLLHSLFAGAVFARATLATGSTGRLGSDPTRRLGETAAFVVAALQPGDLEPGQPGFETAARVRLLHASVRRWIEADELIGSRYIGTPIDQTMLAMTNCLFSHLNVRSLRRLGHWISPDDELAHHHLWRYVGHLMGIDGGLLPDSPEGEAELWEALVAHQAMPQVIGPDHLDYSATAIARQLGGGRRAVGPVRDLLLHLSGPAWFGVDNRRPTRRAVVEALRALGVVSSTAYRLLPGVSGVMARRGRRRMQAVAGSASRNPYELKVVQRTEPEAQARRERALVEMADGIRRHLQDPTTQLGAGSSRLAGRRVEATALDRASLRLSRQLNVRPKLAAALLGPTRWGNPFAGAATSDPYPLYERIRADGPIAWSRLYQQWFVTGFDEAKALLESPNLTAEAQPRLVLDCQPHTGLSDTSRELMQYFLLFIDPPHHTRLRKLISAAFTVRQVARLEESTRRRAEDLLDRLAGAPSPDLFTGFNQPLPIEVIADLLGIDDEHLPFTQELSEALTVYLNPLPRQRDFGPVDRVLGQGLAFFEDLVDQRRRQPRDDLVSAMVQVDDEGDRFEPIEIAALAMFVMFAGHETTSGVFGTAMLALHRFPQERAKLVEHPELWPGAVEELLRFDSALQLDPRTANRDFRFGSHTIRRGQNVIIVLGGANRDPRHFDQPDQLMVDRPDVRSLVFGHGPHFCLGAALARMELRVGLQALLERYPDDVLDLSGVEWKQHPVLRGPIRLPMTRS